MALILLLIVGTIILALIPLYLKPNDVTLSGQSRGEFYETKCFFLQCYFYLDHVILNVLFATDIDDGHTRTLSNSDDLSTQIRKNMFPSGTNLGSRSVQFLSAKASNKKKRETSKACVGN